jgi:hypothetical protein
LADSFESVQESPDEDTDPDLTMALLGMEALSCHQVASINTASLGQALPAASSFASVAMDQVEDPHDPLTTPHLLPSPVATVKPARVALRRISLSSDALDDSCAPLATAFPMDQAFSQPCFPTIAAPIPAKIRRRSRVEFQGAFNPTRAYYCDANDSQDDSQDDDERDSGGHDRKRNSSAAARDSQDAEDNTGADSNLAQGHASWRAARHDRPPSRHRRRSGASDAHAESASQFDTDGTTVETYRLPPNLDDSDCSSSTTSNGSTVDVVEASTLASSADCRGPSQGGNCMAVQGRLHWTGEELASFRDEAIREVDLATRQTPERRHSLWDFFRAMTCDEETVTNTERNQRATVAPTVSVVFSPAPGQGLPGARSGLRRGRGSGGSPSSSPLAREPTSLPPGETRPRSASLSALNSIPLPRGLLATPTTSDGDTDATSPSSSMGASPPCGVSHLSLPPRGAAADPVTPPHTNAAMAILSHRQQQQQFQQRRTRSASSLPMAPRGPRVWFHVDIVARDINTVTRGLQAALLLLEPGDEKIQLLCRKRNRLLREFMESNIRMQQCMQQRLMAAVGGTVTPPYGSNMQRRHSSPALHMFEAPRRPDSDPTECTPPV